MKDVAVAIAGFSLLLLALIFSAYCLTFPIWVYGLLYDRKGTDAGFFSYGLGAPFRDFPIVSFVLVIASLALAVSAIFVPRLSSLFSRTGGILIAISVALIIICCVGIYVFSPNIYKDAVAARNEVKSRRLMNQTMRGMGAMFQQGRAPDVAYYRYLDQERVNSLYAQIEPEWLDKQAVVTDSSSANAKVGVGSGPVTGEIGMTGTQQKQITREAAIASPEKKCRVLMQYASERKGAKSYTTAFNWLLINLVQVTHQHTLKEKPEARFGSRLPLNRAEMQELRLSGAFDMDNSPEVTEEVNSDLRKRNWNAQLEQQLTNLSDYVFVNGDFRINTSPTLLLVHDFVGPDGSIGMAGEKFRPVQFNVTFPPGAATPELVDGSKKLTVFGKVVHGLDRQGTIEIRAIGVY